MNRYERAFLKNAETYAQELLQRVNGVTDPWCYQAAEYLNEWVNLKFALREETVRRLNERLGQWTSFYLPYGLADVNNANPIISPGKYLMTPPIEGLPLHGAFMSEVILADTTPDSCDSAAFAFCKFAQGPCSKNIIKCDRCGKFHLNISGHHNKRYCSRKCAVAGSVKRLRMMRQKEKLNAAFDAMTHFVEKHRSASWKQWVTLNAGVTIQWLTRMINLGKLPDTPFQMKKTSKLRKETIETSARRNLHVKKRRHLQKKR